VSNRAQVPYWIADNGEEPRLVQGGSGSHERIEVGASRHSPYAFWLYKTLVPSLGCFLLWKFRKRVRWMYGAVLTVFAVYFTVVVRSFLYMILPIGPPI
jgi:hypothetical protein